MYFISLDSSNNSEEYASAYYCPCFAGDETETKKVKYKVEKIINLQSYLRMKQENN